MHLPLFFARRYRDSSTRFNTVRLINRFAAFVVGVAVCAFFVVLSVFSGLEQFGLSFSSALDSDLKISSSTSGSFSVDDVFLENILGFDGVQSATPVLTQQVVVRSGAQNIPLLLLGVQQSYTSVIPIEDYIALGNWLAFDSNEMVLGYGAASILGVGLYGLDGGVDCVVPKKGNISPTNPQLFQVEKAIVSGVFQLGNEADQKYAFAPESMVQQLAGLSDRYYSEVLIRVERPSDVDGMKKKLSNMLGEDYTVLKKSELNPALYRMLKTERLVLYMILSLVMAIALFNVVGAVVMMVLDKKSHLQTLHAIGAPVVLLRNVFFTQGLLLSAVGGGVGLLIGLLVVAAQFWGGVFSIPGTSLAYPVVFSIENILVLLIIWSGFSALAAWMASAVVRPRLLR